MTTPQSTNTYGIAVGSSSSIVPYVSNSNPSITSITGNSGPFKIGQRWINESNNTTWTLTSLSASNGSVFANWVQESGSGSGSVTSISGTANEIAVSASTGNVVISVTNPMQVPGDFTANGNITSSTGTLYVSGDGPGIDGTVAFTAATSTSVGSGTGTVKMTSNTDANSAGWIKFFIGTTPYYVPVWSTNAP